MAFAPDIGALVHLGDLLSTWKMTFQSVHYLLFLPLVVGAYFCMPARLRKGWLLLASYYFYCFAAPEYLVVLLAGTVFSYCAGLLVGRAQSRAGRGGWLAVGLAGLLGTLIFFKYNAFFEGLLGPWFARAGILYGGGYFVTAKAVGIGFYTLMAVGYLIDVWRRDIPAQKNLLTHALFLGFFPAVVSGPISRAGALQPQLEDTTRRFDRAAAPDALRQMGIGFFKKLAVADTLAVFVNYIFGDLAKYSGLTLMAAFVGFALQLYFDFSGYTDIALGSAALLGIKLPQNFNTPYFATNFSGLWSRWHMSLSNFLQDYIFTPLVWSRWPEKLPVIGKRVTKPPVLSSIAVVFLVSGLWHGDTLCFIVWGAVQAACRIGEELLHRRLGKPKKNPPLRVRIGKTAVVLFLWVQGLAIFRVGLVPGGTVAGAASALVRQFTGFSLARLGRDVYDAIYYSVYNLSLMVWAFLAFSLVCLALALWADWWQFAKLAGKSQAQGLGALPKKARWSLYYVIALCCLGAFVLQSGGFGGASFIYGGF